MSQPALSVQIKEMEAHLGAPLVERRARDVLLTDFGAQVLTRCQTTLAAARGVEDMARRTGRTGRAVAALRLGVIPTVAPYLLPGVLERLRARDIQMDVTISEGKTETMLAQLDAGRLDAAVLALPVEGTHHAVPLFEDRFVLAGAARQIDVLPGHLSPDDLLPAQGGVGQLLLLEDGHCLADQALAVCGRDRTNDRISMQASSLATLVQLAGQGFGATLLPELALATEPQRHHDIRLRRFSGVEPARTIGLVRRQTTPDDGWFTALCDLIEEVGTDVTRATRNAAMSQASSPDGPTVLPKANRTEG